MLLSTIAAAASALRAQELPEARISQRQVRVVRNEEGLYRLVDAMRVEFDGEVTADFTLAEPLALVQLQIGAAGVQSVGGDLPPGQIVYEPPAVTIVGPVGRRVFEIAMTYTLPDDAALVQLMALLPVENLLVEIDRATVEARPDGSLAAATPLGSETGRLLGYEAADLDAGQAVHLRLTASRVSWPQRIAALIATGLAAAVAGLAVWRRVASRVLAT
jgi:hypothetical protein